MKTLIMYAGKYGTTKKCAEEVARKLGGETELLDLKKTPFLGAEGYDRVVVGTSVYMGQVHKEIKALFIVKHELLEKPLGLFVCCGFPENGAALLEKNVPKDVIEKAKAVGFFGGELDMSRLKGMDKFIAKMVAGSTAKEGKKPPEINHEEIAVFAKEMNKE